MTRLVDRNVREMITLLYCITTSVRLPLRTGNQVLEEMGVVRALRTANNKAISLVNYRRGVPSNIAAVVSPANKQGLSIALHEEAVEEWLAFDATPSFQEAIAATSDLKAAIQT